MSKSITGSGNLNLTVNELRFLEIVAVKISSTDATITNQLNGNNAIFTGTVSINNLVIGTIEIEGALITGDLEVQGTTTLNETIINENLTFNEDDATTAGIKNRIRFNDIGEIIARRDSGLLRQLDIINKDALLHVNFQIRCNENSTYYNTPNVGGNGLHRWYIDTVSKMELTNNALSINDNLIIQGAIGKSISTLFQLPTTAPQANQFLEVLDPTASPPTTQWTTANPTLTDYVSYSSQRLFNNNPNATGNINTLILGEIQSSVVGTLNLYRSQSVNSIIRDARFIFNNLSNGLEFSSEIRTPTGSNTGQFFKIIPSTESILIQSGNQILQISDTGTRFGNTVGDNSNFAVFRKDGNIESKMLLFDIGIGNIYRWSVTHNDSTGTNSNLTIGTLPTDNKIILESSMPSVFAYSRVELERTGLYLSGYPSGVAINMGSNTQENWVQFPQQNLTPSLNEVLVLTTIGTGAKNNPHIFSWASKDKIYNFSTGGIAYFKTIGSVTDITADPLFQFDDVTDTMTCPNVDVTTNLTSTRIETDFIDMANFELNYSQTHNGDNYYILSQIVYSGLSAGPKWYVAANNFSTYGAGVSIELRPDIDQVKLGWSFGNVIKIDPNEILCEGITRITDDLTCNANTILQGDTTITAITNNNVENCRIPFIEGNGSVTGRLCNQGNFYYNPGNTTLVSENILGISQVATPQVVIQGTVATTAQINIDPTYGLFFNHADGYVFRMSGVWKFRIGTNETTVYNSLQCQTSLSVDGDISKDTATLSAVNRDQNIIFHDNDANDKRFKEHNNFHFNPSTETLTIPNTSTERIVLTTGSIFNHTSNVYMAFKANTTQGFYGYNLAFWNDGHNRYTATNSGHRFYIHNVNTLTTTQVFHVNASAIDCYSNINSRENITIQDDNNLTLNETDSTITGVKNEIVFNDIARIRSERDATLNPVLEITNQTALASIPYQIQLNTDSIKSNVPTGGNHDFEINSNSKFEITETETIIKNTLTLQDVSLPTADVDFYILLQNSGNNQVKRSNLVFNPVSEILTINKLQLEGTDIATATDNKILFLDPNDEVEKSDSDLTYNASTSTLTFKKLDNASADSRITVQQPLHYGAGVFSQPLNYTVRIGHTDLIETIDVLGSGLNDTKYGQGTFLSILKSGVKTTVYGQNSLLFDWNAYNSASNLNTNFEMRGLSGLWEVMVTFKFEWDAGNTNRANPIIKAVINGIEQEEGVESQYVRMQLGRVITVKYHNKLYFNTFDTIAFKTYINIGNTVNFNDIADSTRYNLSDFMFMATYMGDLLEYDKTPP